MSQAPPDPAPLLDPAALATLPELEALCARLASSRQVSAGNLWGSSQALIVAALAARLADPLLVVASTDAEARVLLDDLASFGLRAELLPPREGGRAGSVDPESLRRRLAVARAFAAPPRERPRALVASLAALLEPLPPARALEAATLELRVGQRISSEHLLARLVKRGYARVPLVERPGEVSLRGDVFDLWTFAADRPLRVEFFDEEIESLRTFDPVDQRSVERHEALELLLFADTGGVEEGEGVQVAALLAPTTLIVEVEPLRIEDVAQSLLVRSAQHQQALGGYRRACDQGRRLALQSLPAPGISFDTRSVQGLEVGIPEAPAALRALLEAGERVIVCCQTEAERERFGQVVAERGGAPGLEVGVGALARGFRLPSARLVLVHHRELSGLLGRRGGSRRERPAHRSRAIQSFFELSIGDYVVHAVHGLARFEGLARIERSGGEEEHLHLVFADEVSLYVPASRIDVVQRYVGSSAAPPVLDKIGGQTFRKRKEKVQRALVDLAADLLEVHAQRALRTRERWQPDAELVGGMVAEFPHEETADQLQADAEIEADLVSEHPMDRLLCGDVGFGKTEIAIRAAFRVVTAGGQVAVLVPTTVLAQQHYETFRERLADFPLRVGRLSRYVPPREQKETLAAAARGEVDILIGTHRMLSKDVVLPRLGLLVIDEEQRFGVAHKEHFKRLRTQVDILTLTATPIPRTLEMSLSGVRDISALTVAPEGRQDVATLLGHLDDDELVREALLREKTRGGQVFVLHNRVGSIEAAARRLMQLVPECSFAIGHGQMGARELQRVMDVFTRGDVDVLVATTIIESGLDIPAAGTIVVEDADTFGLSELHQLRGRVGRAAQKAYCYLLIEKHKPLRDIARQRLKALEELSQLGAGFQISMKDLEIRGAGNILGPEQSGHISAVGYDLYCRLLKSTIERLQAGESLESVRHSAELDTGVELELGLRAYLPDDWIPEPATRLEILRRLSEIGGEEDARAALEMLRDRFGRVPPEAEALVRSFLLKARLDPLGLVRLAWKDGFYLLEFRDRVAIEGWLGGRRIDLRPIRTGLAHLHPPADARTPARALAWMERLLKPPGEPSTIPARPSAPPRRGERTRDPRSSR